MQFKPPMDLRFRSQVKADSWMAGMEETYGIIWEDIFQAQERQSMYARGREITFVVGNGV